MQFRTFSHAYFKDLMQLLSCDRVSKDCRCLSHRVEPQDLELDALAEAKMQMLSGQRKVHGLLAVSNDEVCAWVGIEPMPTLVGHDVYEYLLENEFDYHMRDDHWAIHCLFVKEKYRGQNIVPAMIQEAIKYATDRGATKILGFGAPADDYKNMPISHRFSGSKKHYLDLGFQWIGDIGDSYTLLLREVGEAKPRLRSL